MTERDSKSYEKSPSLRIAKPQRVLDIFYMYKLIREIRLKTNLILKQQYNSQTENLMAHRYVYIPQGQKQGEIGRKMCKVEKAVFEDYSYLVANQK